MRRSWGEALEGIRDHVAIATKFHLKPEDYADGADLYEGVKGHLAHSLKRLRTDHADTTAPISLAWVLHKYPNVVPIPGSKDQGRILEDLRASEIELTEVDLRGLDEARSRCKIYGHRGHVEEIPGQGALQKDPLR